MLRSKYHLSEAVTALKKIVRIDSQTVKKQRSYKRSMSSKSIYNLVFTRWGNQNRPFSVVDIIYTILIKMQLS